MRIVVDAHGGDNAPLEIIKGCCMAAKELKDVSILLVGRKNELQQIMSENGLPTDSFEIVDAPDILTMEDDPTSVLKEKQYSSMAVAFRLLKEDKADAFVSAGNSGAVLVGATLLVKRIRGIKRAALGAVMPSVDGPYMMLDCGANVECKPEYLDQFGMMGSLYMKSVLGIENPRVALLNNGTEECKGPELQQQAYQLLKSNPNINFIGNIEGREMPLGGSDVIVSDGFAGNVALKVSEGWGKMFSGALKGMLTKNLKSKLAALLIMDEIKAFRKKMDYKEYGGAPLLGISKPVIKAHGSSDAKAFKNAIRQACSFAESNMILEIEKSLNKE
ncbi:MAG: phosphate acyltransferase PlsX [Clostridia bacterium]|nr:phosphate acyltransferase PlsX [Clostridia bacterium]